MRRIVAAAAACLACLYVSLSAVGKQSPATELHSKIDQIARRVLEETGVPSASVAIVRDGKVDYVHAYGQAKLSPAVDATTAMRYSIGSISKQFTAACILLLQDQGKLSLNDPVGKFIPGLTRGNEITIRHLLSHTSGYQDYWPQDYVPPFMLKPTTAEQIMTLWARKPLDFEPGTKWQYSNTNYVIAGAIVEKVAGMPLFQFERERIFTPLGMTHVQDIDEEKLGASDPTAYTRFALGPLRPAPKEGKGWLFGAGDLAMPVEELARWDISFIDQKVLKPTSYKEMQTQVLLRNGVAAGYGLGVSIASRNGHRMIEHNGEVSGFTAENMVFPDDRTAIVVLTNQDAGSAGAQISGGIASLLTTTDDKIVVAKLDEAIGIFTRLQQGRIDRSLFTEDANSYFSEQALQDFASSLGPLGAPESFRTASPPQLRGGMTLRSYTARFAKRTLRVWTYEMPDGKIEQYQVAAQ